MILLELPRLESGFKHEVKLLVTPALRLRQTEECPGYGEKGPAKPEESRQTCEAVSNMTMIGELQETGSM